jgi:hypothetical protein
MADKQKQEKIEMRRVILSLCPHCQAGHVLDNGRVWALCGTNALVGEQFSEREIRDYVDPEWSSKIEFDALEKK